MNKKLLFSFLMTVMVFFSFWASSCLIEIYPDEAALVFRLVAGSITFALVWRLMFALTSGE